LSYGPVNRWVIGAIKTITPAKHKDLRKVSIRFPTPGITVDTQEQYYQQWMDLDRVLAEFCELSQTRVKVSWHDVAPFWISLPEYSKRFLPRVTGRGLVVY
jgi:hypothetical protein